VFGPEWNFLGGAMVFSTLLAKGSPVQVFPKGKLKGR
jgi:hypothetical protein